MDKSLRPTGRPFSRSFREMYIRWGNSIRLVLKETTAACANGYAVRCAEPAVFQRRCCITSRLLPSAFSTSTMGSSEAAYILGHHQKWLHHFLGKPDQATQHRTGFCADCAIPLAACVSAAPLHTLRAFSDACHPAAELQGAEAGFDAGKSGLLQAVFEGGGAVGLHHFFQ